jgi:CubicO group peptidase (beta-lactamase class C family)
MDACFHASWRVARSILRGLLVLAASAGAGPPVLAQRGPDYAPTIAELERIIPIMMETSRVPGLSVALVDGQRAIWSRGFGHTDRTRTTPVTDETLFSLQSISKTYTAVGVMLAVQRGWLALDDPLKKHLPSFTVNSRLGPEEAGRITIRHLLSHRAGFGHEAPVGGNFDDRPTTFERHIASISDAWLMFPVGQRYSYSNLGIDLAGYVLQVLAKRPFPEYMREELFQPLGMDASTFDQAEAWRRPSVARGHAGERQVPDLQIVIVPSGGMYSTAKDMAKFVAFALAGGVANGRRVLDAGLLEEMATPQFRAPGQVGGYGLGLASQPSGGTIALQHGGGGYGFSTSQFWIPTLQVGAVVLSNQGSGVPGAVVDTALRMMIRAKHGSVPPTPAPQLTDRPAIEVAAEVLGRLPGSYKPRGGVIRFELREGALYRGQTRLTAHGPTELSSPGARYRFDLGPDGNPIGVEMLNCCGLEYWPYNDGPRDPPGPDRPEWAPYVGSYRARIYGGDQPLTVSVKNGHLYLDWGGGVRLREFRPGFFFTPDGEAVLFEPGRVLVGNRPFVRAER